MLARSARGINVRPLLRQEITATPFALKFLAGIQSNKSSPKPFSPRCFRTGTRLFDGGDSATTREGSNEYLLPHPGQEQEQERLDLQHSIFKIALEGALNWAPVDRKAPRVLDVATGTGMWAIEFAKEHPDATVVGTELTEIKEPSPVPNCTFAAADAEAEPWPFEEKFDYIHLRMTISCFNSRRKVLQNCFANLNPGGWIELQDVHLAAYSDDRSAAGTALETWCQAMVKGTAALGRNLHDTARYVDLLTETGFKDVTEKRAILPWSDWSSDPQEKELGRLQALNSRQGGRGASAKILAAAGRKPEDIKTLLSKVKGDLENPKIHAYAPIYVVYGRKPN